jgi:hypothetical protein
LDFTLLLVIEIFSGARDLRICLIATTQNYENLQKKLPGKVFWEVISIFLYRALPFIIFLKTKKSEINENRIQEGVYQCITGPSYETVAEMKMAQSYGVDALGMSTVYEVLAARQCGLKCLAISLITNECKTSYEEVNEVSHEEVVEVADKEGSKRMIMG